MKIVRFDLLAFGPFTEQSLNFEQGKYGLHLVFGPNEAGKTSSLRALRNLFFGIPRNCTDNFLHTNPNLKVGAVLQTNSGETLEFIRRKGLKNTLLNPASNVFVPEDCLRALIGNISETVFSKRFAIGHEDLREGGRALMESGGELGESLFSAGSGLTANLRRTQKSLMDRAEQLFKYSANATNPRINKNINELTKTRKQIADSTIKPTAWEELDLKRQQTEKLAQDLDDELCRLRKEKSRLERAQKSWPLIVERDSFEYELQSLAGLPSLAEDFSEHRSRAVANQENWTKEIANARDSLELLSREIESIHIRDDIRQQKAAIKALNEKLAVINSDAKAKTAVDSKLRSLENEVSGLRESIAIMHGMDADFKPTLPNKRQKKSLHELASRYDKKQEALTLRLEAVAKARRTLEQLTAKKADQPVMQELSGLKTLLTRIRRKGDLENRRGELNQQVKKIRAKLQRDLKKLPLWQGSLDEFQAMSIPLPETIDRFDDEMTTLHRELSEIESQQDKLVDQQTKLRRKLEQILRTRNVPTEIELKQAREVRDRGWSIIRGAWESGVKPESSTVHASMAENPDLLRGKQPQPNQQITSIYEDAVSAADNIADRLRHEAEHVAEKTQLASGLDEVAQNLLGLEKRLQETRDSLNSKHAEWCRIWESLKIIPLTAKEMRAWIAKHTKLTAEFSELQAFESELADINGNIESFRTELTLEISRLELHDLLEATQPDRSLGEMLDLCESTLTDHERKHRHYENLAQKIEEATTNLDEAVAEHEQAVREFDDLNRDWDEAINNLGLETGLPVQNVLSLLDLLENFHNKSEQLEDLRQQVAEIKQRRKDFDEECRVLIEQLAPELTELVSDRSALELIVLLEETEKLSLQLASLDRKRLEEKTKLARLEQNLFAAETELAQLCTSAGCDNPQDLPALEAKVKQRRSCEDNFKRLSDHLKSHAGEHDLNAWIEHVRQCPQDDLNAEYSSVCSQIELKELEYRENLQEAAKFETKLKLMDGETSTAELLEYSDSLLVKIRHDAEEYIRHIIANRMLSQAIEGYRSRQQGTVLTRAGELFSELTLGSYNGLEVDFNDGGQECLFGVGNLSRRSGSKIPVEGMSEGTRDQLYLALRIALLEAHFSRHEPIPFVVDDVLVMFDDNRAAAALRILARLSEMTQVIFFTHHQHLIELAQSCIDDDVLFIHHLTSTMTSSRSSETLDSIA